jgi:exodeoxyribonuclease V gamma subunit
VLRIFTSHRTEVLLDTFVHGVADERARRGPFAPIAVVIPNGNVETYLRLGIAERLGIAANLDMVFLRRLLAGLGERAVPDGRVADATVIEGHLLALLHDDDFLARPELTRVRDYLLAAGGERDAVDRRRVQLGETLAHLFDEYASARPDMLAAWRQGARATTDDLEIWQRALWLAIFGPDGRLPAQGRRDGVRWLPLGALWDEAMATTPPPLAGGTLHVFGISYVATAYHRMLGQLAAAAEVCVYTLNPCREDAAALRAGAPVEVAPDTHLAVNLWARPGRANLRLWAAAPGATCTEDFPAGDRSTVLRRLQADIVAGRAPAAGGEGAAPDDSLVVLPCPSLRRELEVVAAEIWRLLRADESLRASDIAVIVPDRQKDLYLAQLPSVFADSCDLPHNVTDLPAAGSHRAAEAIALLIDLPFSTFTRKEVLPLVTHPCLLARFPDATAEDFQALAAGLGIVRGAERADFAPAYLQRDLYSWDQGLRRLALGAVADRPDEDGPVPIAVGGADYLPGPLTFDRSALGFGLLARSLLGDAAFAAGRGGERERPLAEWLDFLRALVRAYLVVDEDDGAGRAVVAGFLAALDGLADSGLGDAKVSYRVAALLAQRGLGALPSGRGHYLASGVTVASFVPMRAIPFRAVFVLGLGQDAFPRPPGLHELDLRAHDERPGDVDGRQQDLYMFLETLLSARDHVRLSYVSRDEITGDELPASPALLQLRAVLQRGYLDAPALARLFGDHGVGRPPLRRYDDRAERRAVLPAAEAEHRARALGVALGPRLPPGSSPRQRLAGLPAPLATDLAHVLGLPALPAAAEPRAAQLVRISLALLRRFLEDPLQASARLALGMAAAKFGDGGDAEVEHEPFDDDPLLRATLARQSMMGAILAAQGTPPWPQVEACFERASLSAELAGRGPAGIYRTVRAERAKGVLAAWHAVLPRVLGPGKVRCRRFRFVPDLQAAPAGGAPVTTGGLEQRRAPSFTLTLPAQAGAPLAVTVVIVGETGLWAGAAADRALAFTPRTIGDPDALGKEDLAAFLDHAALAAAGDEPRRSGFSSVLFHTATEPPDARAHPFGGLSAAEGLAYLRDLCTALLAGGPGGAPVHPYQLPYEAVLASQARNDDLLATIERHLADEEKSRERQDEARRDREPLPSARERYAPPAADAAARMVAERFGLFFRLAHTEDDR